MKRFMIFTRAMLLMHLRNGAVLFWNFAFPVFLILLYGAIAGQLAPGQTTAQTMAYMTPGIIVLNAMSFGLVSSSTMMLEMRDKGVLRRLRATPLPPAQLVAAYLAVNMGLVLAQSAIIVLTGMLAHGVVISAGGLALGIPMIMAGAAAFLALGGIISGAAPKAGVATGVGMLFYFGLMFVSDLIMPIDMMPAWIQALAPYLPSTAAVSLVRTPLLEGVLPPDTLLHLALLGGYGVAATWLAAWFFRWEPKA